MYIKKVSEENVLIEETYRMSKTEWNQIAKKQENVSLVEQFATNKQRFIGEEGSPNTMVTTVFTEFLKYELKYKKEMVEFSYQEFLEVINDMINEGIFTSESFYYGFISLIYHYTEWGYKSHIRKDIITYEDVTQNYPVSEAVSKKLKHEKILTLKEMIEYAQKCPNEYAELGLLLIMEGLRISELTEIKIDNFTNSENHPIYLDNRIINISDTLYDKIKYCIREVTGFERNYKGIVRIVPYVDTGYLFRPQDTKRIRHQDKLTTYNVTVTLNKNLQEAGYDGTAVNFRTSSILNDYMDGMGLDKINDKYGLNCKSFSEIHGVRYKANIDILNKKKRNEVNTNKIGN